MTYISAQYYSGEKYDSPENEGVIGIRQLHSPSESQKLKGEYLYFWADHFIGSCQRDGKAHVNRAYFQKLGEKDPTRQMRLNRHYGIAPDSIVNHVPIIEPYWRRLKGTHKSTPVRFQTTANNTGSLIARKKEKAAETLKGLAALESQVFAMRQQGLPTSAFEKIVDDQHDRMSQRMQTQWRSSLEIESQHALNYLVDRCCVSDVFDDLFDDYGTTRICAWQTMVTQTGVIPTFRALDPRHLYFSKNSNTKWIRHCDAYVYKERMLVSDVITRYGSYLDERHLQIIESEKAHYYHYNGTFMSDAQMQESNFSGDPEIAGLRDQYVDVWYVEWKANNKKGGDVKSGKSMVEGPDKQYSTGYRQDLYRSTRIGSCIYLDSGRVEQVVRHQDNPDYCDLTADGIVYDARFGQVDSLWQRCQHLNDDYDIYKYHLSSYLARSGQKVSPVILEHIPNCYGNNDSERILEHYRREKEGMHVITVSMPGFNAQMQQAIGGVRDTTISSDVRVMIDILGYIEEMVSRIIGVPRQALGDVGQTDGKGTTQMALMQYLMVSQDIFMDMHKVKQCALTSLLNAFGVSFPKGFTGSYAQQGRQMQFETGKNFSLASYNVFLSNSGEEQALLDLFRQIASDMAAQGKLEKEDLLIIMSTKSLAEIQVEMYQRLEAQKNNLVNELQQKLSQMEQELGTLKREIDVNQQADIQVSKEKLGIEAEKVRSNAAFRDRQLGIQDSFQQEKIALDKKRINLEGAQLLIGTGGNEEIRDN